MKARTPRVRRLREDGTADTILPGPTGPGAMLRLLERPNPYYSGVLQWIATVIDLKTRGDTLSIRGLHERTGVQMFGLPDGSVLIKHQRGLPVWGNLPE